jgi:hypothetical protein
MRSAKAMPDHLDMLFRVVIVPNKLRLALKAFVEIVHHHDLDRDMHGTHIP